jgi:hypothetical protein
LRHQWSWSTSEWGILPETLEDLESQGWEIFAVIEIGEMGRFVKIVYRKRLETN